VRAGEGEVVLVVGRAADLRLRVEGWREAWTADGSSWTSGGMAVTALVGPDGRAVFPRLSSDQPWSFYAGPLPGGRYARASGLVPGGEEVVVPLAEGLEIRGRLVLPAGATKPHVRIASDGLTLVPPDALRADGTFLFRGLFPGRWTITASARIEGTYREATVEAEAGADGVVLRFE